MNFPSPQNLKPFTAVRPSATGADLTSRPLRHAVPGEAGRAATAPKSDHDQLTEKTRTWVAQTFFGTLLKQMRNSPFKSELFSGGQGGQSFGSLYDQHLAEHMTRGAGSKLVNGIVRRIEANAAYRKQAATQRTAKDDGSAGDRNVKRPSLPGASSPHSKSRTMRSRGATALRA
jgi:Rod binding domain-containing protein